jgi:5-methylcytosine-specific restriction endonuclease McrA
MEDRGAIGFAEKLLALLDEGKFTATYKYAVLLGLMDLCLENTTQGGMPPETVTTRQLALKVIELYWPHSTPYQGQTVLRQNAGRPGSQAEILTAIRNFRDRSAPEGSAPLARARAAAPKAFERLARSVEWKLIEMPLPRLQVVGVEADPFVYTIRWDQRPRYSDVARYQQEGAGPFDNRISLRPRVGEYLVQVNGLLRPLIHRQWARMVAQLNRLQEARLEAFLFGAERIATEPVRPALQELQGDRCFYCEAPLRNAAGWDPVVDHFIPWARYADNGLENLVVAHRRCNGAKRDFLAAVDHVRHWCRRASLHATELAEIAARARWERDPGKTESVARAIYLRLPDGAKLWLRGGDFLALDRAILAGVFR